MAIIKNLTKSDMIIAKMNEIYLRAERTIINEITRKRSLGLVDYADVAALKRVQQTLINLQTSVDKYIPQAIEAIFYDNNKRGYANAQSLTIPQTQIVEQLVNNLLSDINEATTVAYSSAKNYLNFGRQEADLIRSVTLEYTAQMEAKGGGWRTIQKESAARLNSEGITAFVDKAGRKWSLESYCSMATRTTGRQAQVAALLTADDWDLWQISKIGSTCPICSVYEGRVYSKSGTNPDYPPLSMAFGKIDPYGSDDLSNTYLNIHPNCLHTLIRYTTAGKSEKQIERDKEFSSFENRPADIDYRSKKQIEAYRKKETARAKHYSDVRQYREYKAGLGDNFPKTFKTFEKHKDLNDETYKDWQRQMREVRKEAKEINEAIGGNI